MKTYSNQIYNDDRLYQFAIKYDDFYTTEQLLNLVIDMYKNFTPDEIKNSWSLDNIKSTLEDDNMFIKQKELKIKRILNVIIEKYDKE